MPSSEADHVRRIYRAIHQVIRRIPRGRVATYGQVAELAGLPGGARLAAAALKTSTPADRLPWQRVIAKAGRTRGRIAIHDPIGAAVQRQLLEGEGVPVGDSGLVALVQFGWLPGDPAGQGRGRRAARAQPADPDARAGSARGASPRRPPRSGSTRRASPSRR